MSDAVKMDVDNYGSRYINIHLSSLSSRVLHHIPHQSHNHTSFTPPKTITMKLAIAAALLYAAATSGWKLDLWTTDGRHTSMHGRLDACNNIEFVPVRGCRQLPQ